ncbi:hypothetical protein HYE67_008406 [Fusarium culmorum]|uniref:Uncharacterized protein n=1 Tax=Fusarium culmorum TaxID=5516 RepID=A0A7S8HZ40_FUSCU|nr:hypothetical protein HYE67_008406 [Fusarium culmorum]
MNSHPAPVMSWTFLNASTLNSSKPISSRGNASVRYRQTRYHFIKRRAGSFFCKVVNLNIFKLSVYGEVGPATRQANVSLYMYQQLKLVPSLPMTQLPTHL